MREETEKFRALEAALTAEKVRFGAMNAACKVALARIAQLQATLQALADEFAILAAKGIVPAINNAVLVEAIELLAALSTEGADVSEYEQMEVIRLNKRISTLEHELKQSKAFHQAYTEPLIERIAQLEAALRALLKTGGYTERGGTSDKMMIARVEAIAVLADAKDDSEVGREGEHG
jgi:hypothetical protein